MQIAAQPLQDDLTRGEDDTAVERTSLLGLSMEEVEARVVAAGLPKFRARQLWRRIWRLAKRRATLSFRYSTLTDL